MKTQEEDYRIERIFECSSAVDFSWCGYRYYYCRLCKRAEKRTKRAEALATAFYVFGFNFRVTINSMDMLPCDHSLVLSICTLWGLAIGTFVEGKEKK